MMKKTDNIEVEMDGVLQGSESQSREEPPLKRFKHLTRVCNFLDDKETEGADTSLTSPEEAELHSFLNTKYTKEELSMDPFDFWVLKANIYPNLSLLACEILATPAATAAVERVFSNSGEATRGKRNRLGDYNLEREVLLRKNKLYINLI